MEIKTDIPIDKINKVSNLRNDKQDIDDLKCSIEQHGLLQPIVVSKKGKSEFRIVAGHRRYLACKELGHTHIAAVIQSFKNPAVIQITENIQRTDMSKQEESKAIAELKEKLSCNLSDLSRLLGKDTGWIKKRICFHTVRQFLIDQSFSSRSINELTFDIAKEMSAYEKRYWNKLAAMSLGKRWYPEKLKKFYYSITHPESNSSLPAKKRAKDALSQKMDKAEKNKFSIEADDHECILKLLFVETSTYKHVKEALQEIGGEVI